MIDILGWFWTSAILVISLGTVLLLIAIYNSLVRLRQTVRQGVADIDAQLRQRHDLIPNLVEAVKGYAGHEAATLEAVISARNAAAREEPSSASDQKLRVALDNLLALGVTDRRFGYPLELLDRAVRAGWRITEQDVSYLPRAAGTRSKVSGSVRGTLRTAHDFWAVLR